MDGQAKVTLTFEDGRRETVTVTSRAFVIGRSAECQVVLSDPYISRKHLAVEYTGQGFRVQDLKSSAGSKIGDEVLPAETWSEYHPDEALHLGGSNCVITLEWSHVASPTKSVQDRHAHERANQVIERAMKLSEEAMAASQVRARQEAERLKEEAREAWRKEKEKLDQDWLKERAKKDERAESEIEKKLYDRSKKIEKLDSRINDLQKTIVELESNEIRLKPLSEELKKNQKENERLLKEGSTLEIKIQAANEDLREIRGQLDLARQEVTKAHADRGHFQNDKVRLEQEIQILKKTLETLNLEGRRQVEAELTLQKEKLTKDLESLALRERTRFDEQNRAHVLKFHQRKKQFVESLVIDITGTLKASGVSESGTGKSIEKQVRESSQRIFEAHYNELVESDHTKSTLEVNAHADYARRLLKWSAATIVVCLGLAFAIEPKLINRLGQFVTSTNEKGETAAETYSREMVEQAQKNHFQPAQTDEWRESVTERILYMRHFAEAQKSPELEKEWIQKIHRVFTKDLDVDEDVVTTAIGIERSMVTRLLEEREKIHPDFVQLGIEKMQGIETDASTRLHETLKKKKLFTRWQSESEEFWKSALTREPASPQNPHQNTGSSEGEDPVTD